MNKKSTQVLQGLVLALAGSATQMLAGSALAAEERAGIVKSVRGDVQLLSAAGTARPASPGDARWVPWTAS